jgi:glucosylglycerate synthase
LAEESILTDDFIRQLITVGEVDILVGVPTYNDAQTVEPAIRAIQTGILKSFPRERAVIINADGGSTDGTPDVLTGASISDVRHAFNGYTLRTLHSISTQYAGGPSNGTALHTILAAAELLRAKACAIISPESTAIQADWVSNLLRPIYSENFDFVAPIYSRHKFEGILLSNLVYPMTRALYGQRVREPYASDFGFSCRLGNRYLNEHSWHREAAPYGLGMGLTISALAEGFGVYQTFLGKKGGRERKSPDLVHAMRQTVGVLFSSLETTFSAWSSKGGSHPVPTNGATYDLTLEPFRTNRKQLKQMFSVGVAELESVLKSILTESTLGALQQIASLDESDFCYPAELWVKTVYEFAASYSKSVMSRDHILQALAPLYRGRMFTFLMENRTGSAEDVENNIENLCLEFERWKPYLLELWNGRK